MMKSSMNQIETSEANDEPLASKGERSSSRLSPKHAGTVQARRAPLAAGQRWSVARKREVVLGLLRGESSELLCREFGVPISYGQIICPTDAPSRRITMIVAQEPTQSLATLHRPLALTIRHQRK